MHLLCLISLNNQIQENEKKIDDLEMSELTTKTKKDIKRLNKYKKEFKEKRRRNIYLWGKAIEGV